MPMRDEWIRVVPRPYTNPLPLGFFSFAVGMASLLALACYGGSAFLVEDRRWPTALVPRRGAATAVATNPDTRLRQGPPERACVNNSDDDSTGETHDQHATRRVRRR